MLALALARGRPAAARRARRRGRRSAPRSPAGVALVLLVGRAADRRGAAALPRARLLGRPRRRLRPGHRLHARGARALPRRRRVGADRDHRAAARRSWRSRCCWPRGRAPAVATGARSRPPCALGVALRGPGRRERARASRCSAAPCSACCSRATSTPSACAPTSSAWPRSACGRRARRRRRRRRAPRRRPAVAGLRGAGREARAHQGRGVLAGTTATRRCTGRATGARSCGSSRGRRCTGRRSTSSASTARAGAAASCPRDDRSQQRIDRRWVQTVRVVDRGLRSTEFVAAGDTLRILPGAHEGRAVGARRDLHHASDQLTPGDSYARRRLRAAPERRAAAPRARRRDRGAAGRPRHAGAGRAPRPGHPRPVPARRPDRGLRRPAVPRLRHQRPGPVAGVAERAGHDDRRGAPILEHGPYARLYALTRRLAAGADGPYDLAQAILRARRATAPPTTSRRRRRASRWRASSSTSAAATASSSPGRWRSCCAWRGIPARVGVGLQPRRATTKRGDYVVRRHRRALVGRGVLPAATAGSRSTRRRARRPRARRPANGDRRAARRPRARARTGGAGLGQSGDRPFSSGDPGAGLAPARAGHEPAPDRGRVIVALLALAAGAAALAAAHAVRAQRPRARRARARAAPVRAHRGARDDARQARGDARRRRGRGRLRPRAAPRSASPAPATGRRARSAARCAASWAPAWASPGACAAGSRCRRGGPCRVRRRAAPYALTGVPRAGAYELYRNGTELLEKGDFHAAVVPLRARAQPAPRQELGARGAGPRAVPHAAVPRGRRGVRRGRRARADERLRALLPGALAAAPGPPRGRAQAARARLVPAPRARRLPHLSANARGATPRKAPAAHRAAPRRR